MENEILKTVVLIYESLFRQPSDKCVLTPFLRLSSCRMNILRYKHKKIHFFFLFIIIIFFLTSVNTKFSNFVFDRKNSMIKYVLKICSRNAFGKMKGTPFCKNEKCIF